MVAACMVAECGISRRVRLVPPAHHHRTLLQSSNRPNALILCPATTSLPPCFYNTCGSLMVAACMAAECGISRRVQLVPPAHHHETLLQNSNRPNALLPCPATTSLPPCLLHYLWRSHGGCLHGSRMRNFQTCTACASSAPP
jgi:hypothetical protein